MISKINSCTINGLEAILTEVEVGFSRGIPGVTVVGLPDNAVKESKERIRFAIKNSGYEYPGAAKIVVNLSPADLKKEGSSLDLPIAVGIIQNSYKIENNWLKDFLFFGELNLNGELNHVKGILNLALFAKHKGFRGIVIPEKNGIEASFVKGIEIYTFKYLKDVGTFLVDPDLFNPLPFQKCVKQKVNIEPDFKDVKGQYLCKRVMEIASAGFHNVLMIGPPGSGKSMLSKALPTILPDMTDEEILETSLIYSAAGLLNSQNSLIVNRPFRSPHHTISDVGISGGGKYPVPGEISLAHNGVLFLDEIPYFKKSALEVLRQPLEDGHITISRSLISHTYPAKFMLVAAMNPCEDSMSIKDEHHYCTQAQKRKYYGKISKPLLDRIDLQIQVKRVEIHEITSNRNSESSESIKKRVKMAREIQLDRFKKIRSTPIFGNGQMRNREIKRYCRLDNECESLFINAIQRLNLSARSYFKILKISRTIADLDNQNNIQMPQIQEALQYRSLDFNKV